MRRTFDELNERVEKLEEELNNARDQIFKDIQLLRSEVHDLSVDVRKITTVTETLANEMHGINTNLAVIARSIESVSDLHDTWQKIKGFWAVVSWIRSNVVVLGVLGGMFLWVIYMLVNGGFKL